MFPVLGISDGIAVPLYLHIGKNLLLIDQCMTDFLITEFICTFYRHFRSAALYGSVEDRLHLLVEKRFRGELNRCQGCAICK